ncbi:MAG: hypothetical protein WCI11_19635 [Candidatus Methylumidiphilus sp.]
MPGYAASYPPPLFYRRYFPHSAKVHGMGLAAGRPAPDRQALPVVLSAIGLPCPWCCRQSACPARSGRPVPVAHAVLGVGMLADGEGLPVVLALFEVPACPWLRSPSSQTAKGRTPLAGRLGLGG